MKELKELENKINEMKKRIEELEEENGKLEYNLFVYDTERKERMIKHLNIYEKSFIEFIEEYQNDNCCNDRELCKNYSFFNLFDDFTKHVENNISMDNIERYFNYDEYKK